MIWRHELPRFCYLLLTSPSTTRLCFSDRLQYGAILVIVIDVGIMYHVNTVVM